MRTTARVLAILWVVVGVGLWNQLFDLYVSRGAREYGQLRVEAERDRTPAPDMTHVMDRAKRDGVYHATLWTLLVVAGGWATLWAASRVKRTP